MDKQGFKFVSITSPKRASFDGSNLVPYILVGVIKSK